MSGEMSVGTVGLARVRGDSMRPTLAPGDRLVVRYGAAVRPGRIVLARLADGTLAVKRATGRRTTASGAPGWWLASDNPEVGVDSRHRCRSPTRWSSPGCGRDRVPADDRCPPPTAT